MQNWNKDNVWSLINKNKISPVNRIFKYYDKHQLPDLQLLGYCTGRRLYFMAAFKIHFNSF